ncbi:MAG TPA: flavin reductase family protein [Pseudonocardia sp.]
MDRATFVELMSGVCAPVTVVTTIGADGLPHGSTVSSFVALSLDPPLVSFALLRGSGLLPHLEPGARVGVNILGANQQEVAATFARRGPRTGTKFDGVAWSLRAGLPYLPDPSGWTAGSVERHVHGGDHVLLLVRVEDAVPTRAAPLVYAHRTFGTHSGLALAS